jgi:hypothetical protein
MIEAGSRVSRTLGLRAGETVEVRSAEEILATLGPDGRVDGLPFMPEMLQFCGKRLRVVARAHKACDTIHKTGCRSMSNAVHLDDARCDGASHGGCQANCLIYWKEAWLKRPGDLETSKTERPTGERYTVNALAAATRKVENPRAFVCQATEMFGATTPMRPTDPRQYLRDLWSGNVKPWRMIWVLALAWFNVFQRWRGGRTFPSVEGHLEKTPSGALNLQPGETVRIRRKEEIVATLDTRQRNRGLYFDKEMLPYCGRTARVAARVERIVNEKTGEMMQFGNDCVRLDGVVCMGIYSDRRLFCPRAITPYWRELWLERVGEETPA